MAGVYQIGHIDARKSRMSPFVIPFVITKQGSAGSGDPRSSARMMNGHVALYPRLPKRRRVAAVPMGIFRTRGDFPYRRTSSESAENHTRTPGIQALF